MECLQNLEGRNRNFVHESGSLLYYLGKIVFITQKINRRASIDSCLE